MPLTTPPGSKTVHVVVSGSSTYSSFESPAKPGRVYTELSQTGDKVYCFKDAHRSHLWRWCHQTCTACLWPLRSRDRVGQKADFGSKTAREGNLLLPRAQRAEKHGLSTKTYLLRAHPFPFFRRLHHSKTAAECQGEKCRSVATLPHR